VAKVKVNSSDLSGGSELHLSEFVSPGQTSCPILLW